MKSTSVHRRGNFKSYLRYSILFVLIVLRSFFVFSFTEKKIAKSSVLNTARQYGSTCVLQKGSNIFLDDSLLGLLSSYLKTFRANASEDGKKHLHVL